MAKKAATDAEVRAFMEAVFPDAPDLAMAAFDEAHVLRTATGLINELRALADQGQRAAEEGKPAPDSADWWRQVAQGLGVEVHGLRQRIARLDAALSAAWQDIHDWLRLARRQAEELPDADFHPLAPTKAGIAASERVLDLIREVSATPAPTGAPTAEER